MQLIQRCRLAGVFLLALGFLTVPSLMSQTFPTPPGQHDFILDEAGLIHSQDAQQIKNLCEGLLKEESIPIVVVTIPSLAKYDASDIESYARALFDNWGIGSQTNNYGILLLVSLGDRKARIELGAAWAGTKDETSRMIMDDIIIPNFKKGDYSAGILQGVQALETMARGQVVRKPVPWTQLLLVLGLIALTVGVAISLIRSGHQGWGWALLALLFALIVGLLAIASRMPSGGSFGGGSSGGGGATGSW
jgi:uncharacterized protein